MAISGFVFRERCRLMSLIVIILILMSTDLFFWRFGVALSQHNQHSPSAVRPPKIAVVVVVEVIFSRGAWVVVGGGFCFKPLSSSFGNRGWLCSVVCKFFVFNSNENFHFLIRKVGWWHNSVLLLFSEQGGGSGRVAQHTFAIVHKN